MDKEKLVSRIVTQLEQDLHGATQAALESAEDATDEESRAENKYDTRGLESSYLASAQAHHAKELQAQLEAIRNMKLEPAGPATPVRIGSLVTTLSPEGREHFFIAPAEGGLEIEESGKAILVLTPKSPLGSMMVGKQVGGRTNGPVTRTIINIE